MGTSSCCRQGAADDAAEDFSDDLEVLICEAILARVPLVGVEAVSVSLRIRPYSGGTRLPYPLVSWTFTCGIAQTKKSFW
jgi:hypothetical protein